MTKEYAGGYFLMNDPIVRGYGPNAHTAKDLSKLSKYTIDALNHIQETPWAVNEFILETVNRFKAVGHDVGFTGRDGFETVLRLVRPESPRNDPDSVVNVRFSNSEWVSLSHNHKQAHKERVAKAWKSHEETSGVYNATLRIITTANEMAQFEKFYFPHNMDFRTRIYPIPTDLNPQSNDLSKGLLRFARGMRLGSEGVFWLGVTVASQWGEDKPSMGDRFRFASDPEFFDKCMLWVSDPVVNQGWLKADAPFQFLAVAQEWVNAWKHLDGPEAFVSFLPGNLDGSCNGAQHLSIMSRDPVGAEATNCCTKAERNDLYLEVAQVVYERVQLDAKDGNELAIEWLPRLTHEADRRKHVKRSVMTVPYGVTSYGVAQFIMSEHAKGLKDQWNSAKYLRDLIIEAIETSVLRKGRELQRWFQACAARSAEAGVPFVWDTPAGSKVTQAYRNVVKKRIKVFETEFVVFEEPDVDEDDESFLKRIGLDIRKMGAGAPPNVVHSCDAAHLQITTCRMADAGIKDFSMIHDSFGTHMAQVGTMRDILRQSVVDMYQGDYLKRFKESVEEYSGLQMPEPPVVGSFDINEILTSEYFFS